MSQNANILSLKLPYKINFYIIVSYLTITDNRVLDNRVIIPKISPIYISTPCTYLMHVKNPALPKPRDDCINIEGSSDVRIKKI